nr:MAG TPA: hypothetical protein [Caudoviricetes sp.]
MKKKSKNKRKQSIDNDSQTAVIIFLKKSKKSCRKVLTIYNVCDIL